MENLIELIKNSPLPTQRFLLEFLAIIQKLEFGKIVPKIEIHNKKIMTAEFEGWKRLRYEKNNLQAIKDIGERIAEIIKKKQTIKVFFEIEIKNGEIQDVFWQTKFVRRYDIP